MKIKLVCIGDSLTDGYEIDPSCRWSNLLSKDLGIEIINSGISGDTTAGMLARFKYMALAHNPTHVIIMGGTNDLSFDLSDRLIISNILAMTRHARFEQVASIIGIPTPFYCVDSDPENDFLPDPESYCDRIEMYQKKLRDFAIEDEQPYIDFSLNMKPEFFKEDGIHPNELGHEAMKENAKAALKTIL